MPNIVISNSEEFEKIIKNLENTLPDMALVFDSVDKCVDNINGNDLWYGKTQETFFNKYKEFRNNYQYINESFENYIKFLKITIMNYKNAEDKINKNIENNDANLNVN